MPSSENAEKSDSLSESTTDTLKQAQEKSIDITEEAIRKAALDITQEVKSYAEQPESERKPLIASAKAWLVEQVHRLSQAMIALLVATVVALVTPFLVKMELADEFQGINQSFTSAIKTPESQSVFKSTLAIDESTQSLLEQNGEILNSVASLKSEIGETKSIDASVIDELTKNLENHARIQNQKIDSIRDSIIRIDQSRGAAAVPRYPAGLSQKISQYISVGENLRTDSVDALAIDRWIGEVYFFVSLFPSYNMELDEIKENLKKVHLSEKPYNEPDARTNQTLIALNALHNWMSLSR